VRCEKVHAAATHGQARRPRPPNPGAGIVVTTPLVADARCSVVRDGAVHHHPHRSLLLIYTPALRRD